MQDKTYQQVKGEFAIRSSQAGIRKNIAEGKGLSKKVIEMGFERARLKKQLRYIDEQGQYDEEEEKRLTDRKARALEMEEAETKRVEDLEKEFSQLVEILKKKRMDTQLMKNDYHKHSNELEKKLKLRMALEAEERAFQEVWELRHETLRAMDEEDSENRRGIDEYKQKRAEVKDMNEKREQKAAEVMGERAQELRSSKLLMSVDGKNSV